MKRIYSFCILLTMLLAFSFNANAALEATVKWTTPGSVKIRIENGYVELPANATSYHWQSNSTFGYIYVEAADGYKLESCVSSEYTNTAGKPYIEELSLTHYSYKSPNFPIYVGDGKGNNGATYTVTTSKLDRNDSFTFNVVNGEDNIEKVIFNSGYEVNVAKGNNTVKFNKAYDGALRVELTNLATPPYSFTNGTKQLTYSGKYIYSDIAVDNGSDLKLQVFEAGNETQTFYNFTIEYGEGMDGCLYSIFDTTLSKFIYLDDQNSISLLDGTELNVNFVADDYTYTKFTLNGVDITNKKVVSTFNGTTILPVKITENSVLKVEGKATEYGTVDFTGYIINGEGLSISSTYHGTPLQMPEGTAMTQDTKVTDELTLPADETFKYVIPVSAKKAQIFFSPKTGYYIKDLYMRTPEGVIEQHSGNASMTDKIDGTTFYMVIEKLPETYTANLNVQGTDMTLYIKPNTSLADMWDNPSAGYFSSLTAPGEHTMTFLPGYGTPITIAFGGAEGTKGAVYVDGAEVTPVINEESNAPEYTINPYYPGMDETATSSDLHTQIDIYNYFSQRPQMSGASLVLEDGGEAEFFYSPLMHKANPAGQVVVSGTQFTVRPASETMFVIYKNKVVELNDNGEFVFNATGNARNNIVTVTTKAESAISAIDAENNDNVTVISIDGKVLLNNASADRLNELEKGIYIVNGKKTTIK